MMQKKRTRGASFVELTVGIAFVVPVVLILLDLAIMLIAVEANDANCRQAARAAAGGNPDLAISRAETVVSGCRGNHGMMTGSRLVYPVEVDVSSRPEPEQDIATGKQIFSGGPVQGRTTVSTEIEIRPILIHMFYGGHTPLTFKSTHSFPISYVMPSR